jgi:3-oxoacyl-[acyl-carrier protein] reductase
MRLSEKVAVITGAGSGLGRAMAERFAQEGARLVLGDIDADAVRAVAAAVAAAGGTALAVRADVTVKADMVRLTQTAADHFGGLDIMVNNAGIDVRGTLADLPEDVFDRILAVNLKGVFLGSQAAWPHLVRRGGGVILNTASLAGLVGAPLLGAYAASTGGVVQLTKVLALEGARYGIRANAVCPVFTETPMVTRWLEREPDAEAVRARLVRGIPLRRLGRPEDVVNAALYLVSDEAQFITGVAFPVDGGASAH